MLKSSRNNSNYDNNLQEDRFRFLQPCHVKRTRSQPGSVHYTLYSYHTEWELQAGGNPANLYIHYHQTTTVYL